MQLEAHDLHSEFPEFGAAIHALKLGNSHFAKLFDEYHEVNRHVQRIEVNAELTSDQALEGLKKQRLKLKDELHTLLKAHSPG
ncbi:MAG: YdcH family protein [Rhodocyclaceae bacterium]|jgi:uncharacterized protein YdcH (DUF465 family)|nr:YdcH family protein [Rhodocyclaceae bacterium]